eukprot:8651652-Pyramimonas_sp.AAC.1
MDPSTGDTIIIIMTTNPSIKGRTSCVRVSMMRTVCVCPHRHRYNIVTIPTKGVDGACHEAARVSPSNKVTGS